MAAKRILGALLVTSGLLSIKTAGAEFPNFRSLMQGGGPGHQAVFGLDFNGGAPVPTNIYVLGGFDSTVTFGGITVTNTSPGTNIFIARHIAS
ncbi:MAG: hypothetical protein ACK4UN_13205, partial [Limisphaerales bacterium]